MTDGPATGAGLKFVSALAVGDMFTASVLNGSTVGAGPLNMLNLEAASASPKFINSDDAFTPPSAPARSALAVASSGFIRLEAPCTALPIP